MPVFKVSILLKIFIFILLLSGLPLLYSQSPTQLPDQFYDQKVGTNWQRPVGITFDKNGMGYVWEKRGKVYLLDQNGVKSDEPFINIEHEVGNWGDHGLLGFALDPSFERNGYVYLLYVVDRHHVESFGTPEYDRSKNLYNQATIGRITRYQADVLTGYTTIIEDSRTILLGQGFEDGFPILIPSHGIGSLVFGNDGTLLASCGDGGSYESLDLGSAEETYYAQSLADGSITEDQNVGAFKSQMINSLAGKIIRIDPQTGAGLPSNPFYDLSDPQAPKSKVWVLGFRNPYRFIHVPETGGHFPDEGAPGTFLIGDVGSSSWEELNIAERGRINFGWPLYEGTEPHWGFIFAWTPNPNQPNPLFAAGNCGEFFNFQDLVLPSTGNDVIFKNPCDEFQVIPNAVPTYVHRRPTITWSGKLWNPPPRAKATAFDQMGDAIEYQFDEEASPIEAANFAGFTSIPGFFYEGNNFPEAYQDVFFQADLSGWIKTFHFNEEMKVTKIESFADWADKGVVHIAQDPIEGCIYWCHIYSSEVHKICYGGNPPPVAIGKANRNFGVSPLDVQFSGSESFDPDGSNIEFFWDFGDGVTSTEMNPLHTFTASSNTPTNFEATLTVSDSAGLTNTQKLLISLNNTPPQVSINALEKDSNYYSTTDYSYLPLSATVSDQEHSSNELDYSWEFFFHHNDHYHPEAPINSEETSAIIDPVGCQEEVYWYRIKLTVTDENGLSGSDEKELFPYCGDPITDLSPLQGNIASTTVVLDWQSFTEFNLQTFEIERTMGVNFLPIGTVAAQNNNNSTYQFIDPNPLRGQNHYRLKAINADGIYEYSNTVTIEYPPKLNFSIAPNPASDFLNIYMKERISNNVELSLYNNLGQLLRTHNWPGEIGMELEQTLSLSDLPNGVYLYRLIDGDLEVVDELVITR